MSQEVKLRWKALTADGDSGKFLNRLIERMSGGYALSGDHELVKLSVEELGLEKAKPVMTPSVVRLKVRSGVNTDPERTTTDYRRHVGRLIHVSLDRIDVQYSVKQLAKMDDRSRR